MESLLKSRYCYRAAKCVIDSFFCFSDYRGGGQCHHTRELDQNRLKHRASALSEWTEGFECLWWALLCEKHPLNPGETGMTASCLHIHSHSLIQTESVSQFQTAQWVQGQKEKRGETTWQTQKQKGRQGTDIVEDSEKTGSSPSPR